MRERWVQFWNAVLKRGMGVQVEKVICHWSWSTDDIQAKGVDLEIRLQEDKAIGIADLIDLVSWYRYNEKGPVSDVPGIEEVCNK